MDIQILVVEDDKNIANAVQAFLMEAGYNTDVCYDGDDALTQFYDKQYNLLILDIMLPGVNGKELLREFRKISTAPVLIMTALTEDYHQIYAFDNQADDYVTKPFSMPILMRRVDALLRRSGIMQNEIQAGEYTLYPESYKLLYKEQDIPLTPREFEIMLLLANNMDKVITYDTLLTKIWGYDYEVDERIVHAYIKNLRNKLPINTIKTIRGIGYSLTSHRNLCEIPSLEVQS